jgi:hypothetical protein
MKKSVIETARSLMRHRKYGSAIKLLEGRSEIYEDNFDYYYTLGTACLYAGDTGSATSYYERARRIKVSSTVLLIGQASIFLRRGDTERAVQYYLDVLDNEPSNKIAAEALEFIRTKGDYETICKWVDTGKIEKFYPDIGIKSGRGATYFCVAALVVLVSLFVVQRYVLVTPQSNNARADLSSFALTVEELSEKDLSGSVYHFILSDKQIKKSYEEAQTYFQTYRDNASQVEVNRLLNSNASSSVKQKARLLSTYYTPQTFDLLKDNYDYETVAIEPSLYIDCYVDWSGRITNAVTYENAYRCDLLIGYEDLKTVKGIISVYFDSIPNPPIDGEKPVRILGKITLENGKLSLVGKSIYQSVKD